MRAIKHSIILYIFILTVASNFAQQADESKLSLNRLFKSPEFFGEGFGQVNWIDEGKSYLTTERSKDSIGGSDLVKVDTRTGTKEIIIPSAWLVPEGKSKPISLSGYQWSSNKDMLLIFTNTVRVWRYNTKGDYYLLDLKSKKLKKLGGDASPSTLMFAKFSPDDKIIGYVREHNIYVEDISNGKITQLTSDGSTTMINGTFDWVYEEELDLRDGFRWSPDSKKIAYWQLDASGIGEFLMINNTDSIYSKTIPVQYPKVGTTNSACRVGVVSIAGGNTTWMKVEGDPRNNYIVRMDWAESSDEILIQRMNRKQNKNEVMFGDASNGAVKIIFTETDAAWIDVNDDLHWLNDGKEFTWISERDGWRHVYIYSRDGKKVKLITPGNYDVIKIENVDDKDGFIYFTASPDNATQRYLFRITMDGKGKPEKLTPSSFSGTNVYQISEGANFAIHTFSNIDTPPIVNLIELPSHSIVRKLVENISLTEKINKLQRVPTEFFKVQISGGVELDGYMIKPPNFDPSKKYPILFYVYGEPAAQTVMDRWSGTGYLWHLMFAQEGYIVISIDARGTPAPKGREWRKVIYQQIGALGSREQAEATEVLLKKFSFLDENRIGIWGWSGGGTSTLNALFRFPKIYKVGVAVAAVGDEKLYDTIYQERYMGLISDNPEAYDSCSAASQAKNLEGKLLMIHGTGDDNVHYQNMEVVMNELIKHNKQFSMMAYPNRSHGIYEGAGTRIHLYTLMTDYIHTNLPAGGN